MIHDMVGCEDWCDGGQMALSRSIGKLVIRI